MFGQKKKKAQFNMMGDSRVTCYDFIRRLDQEDSGVWDSEECM